MIHSPICPAQVVPPLLRPDRTREVTGRHFAGLRQRDSGLQESVDVSIEDGGGAAPPRSRSADPDHLIGLQHIDRICAPGAAAVALEGIHPARASRRLVFEQFGLQHPQWPTPCSATGISFWQVTTRRWDMCRRTVESVVPTDRSGMLSGDAHPDETPGMMWKARPMEWTNGMDKMETNGAGPHQTPTAKNGRKEMDGSVVGK